MAIFASVPRQPACAMPIAGVAVSKMKTGTQSAVNTPMAFPDFAEIIASAVSRVSATDAASTTRVP